MRFKWIIYLVLLLGIPIGTLYFYTARSKNLSTHDLLNCVCGVEVDCSEYENHECCTHDSVKK